MTQPQQFDARNLSIAERIILVEEIWDSIVAEQGSLEVTETQRDELDRRLQSLKDSPNTGTSWEDIKHRLQSKE